MLDKRYASLNHSGSMLKAIIFDFDGVIVNTEPLHYKAYQEVLDHLDLGYTWEEYVSFYIGFDDRDAFKERFKKSGKRLSKEELACLVEDKAAAFQRLIAGGVDPYPGVVELIKSLSGKTPVALCSGALRQDVDPILKNLKLDKAFDVIVTADDVAVSKPDPACYALAVKRRQQKFFKKEIKPSKRVDSLLNVEL